MSPAPLGCCQVSETRILEGEKRAKDMYSSVLFPRRQTHVVSFEAGLLSLHHTPRCARAYQMVDEGKRRRFGLVMVGQVVAVALLIQR